MRRIQSINENWLFIKGDIDLQKVNIKEVEKEQVNTPYLEQFRWARWWG